MNLPLPTRIKFRIESIFALIVTIVRKRIFVMIFAFKIDLHHHIYMDFVAIGFKFKVNWKIRKRFQFEENPLFYAKSFLFYGVNLPDLVLGKFFKKHLSFVI